MIRELERLFTYGDWANLAALQSVGDHAVARRRVAHIIGAERTWLHRLTGGPRVEVWPDLDLQACRAQLEDLRARWRGFLGMLDEAAPARKVAYTNTKGSRFESTVGEILLHVALHGAYHRGQIASDVRAAGRDPAHTDFIHATREGIV
jgi:uncharacterized damage-inducible protein DinB